MEPSAITVKPRFAATQRELLGLILGCAVRGDAGFAQALYAVESASEDPDPRTLARELLSDMAIRGWIELRREAPDGSPVRVERLRYELELADPANWDEHSPGPRARYVLTEKGRRQVSAMLSTLGPR